MKSRAHLEAMPPYIPIEPFEILSTDRTPALPDRQAGCKRKPVWTLTDRPRGIGRLDFLIFIPTRRVVHSENYCRYLLELGKSIYLPVLARMS